MSLNYNSPIIIQEKINVLNINDEIVNKINNEQENMNDDDDDNQIKIKLLRSNIKNKYIEINNYQSMINKNKIIIKNFQNEIYNLCDHKWEYDLAGCCMYESPETICTKCNLYKI
jgi:uncharacterized membrane protein